MFHVELADWVCCASSHILLCDGDFCGTPCKLKMKYMLLRNTINDLLFLSFEYSEQFVHSCPHFPWLLLLVDKNWEVWVNLFICFIWGWISVKYLQLFITGLFFPFNKRNGEKLNLQWTLEGHQLGVVSVDISHTGSIAASSSLDAHIRLWDLETGKQIKSIDAGPGKISVLICV